MNANTKRRGIVGGTILALAATVMITTSISAQPGFGGPRGGGRGGMIPALRQLDLTDAQRDQIREIGERNCNASVALMESLRTTREALNQAVMADVVNESAIRGLAARIAPLEADAAVQRAYANAEMMSVLTPDQRAELKEVQAEQQARFTERMQQRRDRR